jgi:hypothetical protein
MVLANSVHYLKRKTSALSDFNESILYEYNGFCSSSDGALGALYSAI